MTTLREVCELYRARLHSEGRLTRDTEQRLATLERGLGKEDVIDITAQRNQSYVLAAYPNRSPGTVNRNLNVLSAVLGLAEEEGLILTKPKVRRRKHRGMRETHLELDEIMPVVEECHTSAGPLYGFIILLLIDTGMRFSEALRLKWGDLKRDWITVRATGSGKTNTRKVPTSPRLIAYMTKYKVLPLVEEGPEDLIILPRFNMGAGYLGKELNGVLRDACEKVGARCGRGIRIHDLRHTFAFICAASGADLGDIKELLGHQQIANTMRYRGFVEVRAADIIRKGMATGGTYSDILR